MGYLFQFHSSVSEQHSNNLPYTYNITTPQGTPQYQERIVNALTTTGELLATNQ
jgi:hypothetical protein